MVCRWSTILLGVVLLQGAITYSPIPEMSIDEEWAVFNEQLRDSEYRLPTTTSPRHYEVSLTPYFDNVVPPRQPFSFDGTAATYVSTPLANVGEIVMHCDVQIITLSLSYVNAQNVEEIVPLSSNDFSCDPRFKFLRIVPSEPLVANREYIVRSTFVGTLQTNMRGFYRSWYRDSSGPRWMATTQFQPGHARQAFPCYDEPGFKATFDITIVREEGFSPTISNMPIRVTQPPQNGRVAETFHTTPVTSTYLLAFIVSHYQSVASSTTLNRPFEIYARNNIGNQGQWSLDVGERLLAVMEDYTQIPYYSMATNMNMKQAAIPDFSAGAMENWGLLTYREALILFDESKTNNFYRQRIANIVSHEIAHMWFGNLVTCAWWDNLWLNEGFARFYQFFLTHMVEPNLGFETRFIVEQVQVSLLSDSVSNAHALTNPAVSNPTTVSAHFSQITYGKGASILRMTQYLLGENTFIKALRRYLDNRKYNVAEPHHLFTAFDEAAVEDNAISQYGTSFTIERYFRSWSEVAGHPLLTVNVNHQTGVISLTQRRFDVNAVTSDSAALYEIPITWTRANSVDFENVKPTIIMSGQTETINRGSTGLEWVVFNKKQTGFYRINYDTTTWALITRALRLSERESIHEYNRAQIIDDLFNFARANIMTYKEALNIISFVEFEDAYAPWIAAITGFNVVRRRLAHDTASVAALHELIHDLSPAIVRRLGYSDIPNEPFMDGLLRMHVMTFLCNVGHEGCVSEGRQRFIQWRDNVNVHIPPNMRPWVYCTGLRLGNAADFNVFWQRYLDEDHASEQLVMIQAAGCTSDTPSLESFWIAMTDTSNVFEIVRPQDMSSAISSAITGNEENTMKSFAWIRNNLERTRNSIGLSSPLSSIFQRLLNENQINEATTWLEQVRNDLQDSEYQTAIYAINTARSNIGWYQNRASELLEFFETRYEEVDIDNGGTITTSTTAAPVTDPPVIPPGTAAPPTLPTTTEATTTTTALTTTTTALTTTTAVPTTTSIPTTTPDDSSTEEPQPEPEPGSANIAALSVVTLLVTLSINLLA